MPIRFIVFGDTKVTEQGINKKVLERIMKATIRLKPKPSFYISLGDCVAGSIDNKILKEQLLCFKNIMKGFYPEVFILPVVGNHEVNNFPNDLTAELILKEILFDFKKKYRLDGYNDTVYCMDLDNCRFIFLNTYHLGELKKITDRQLKWLREVCSTDKKFKLLFLHDPPYPTGAHLNTCLDRYPEERDELWKIIDGNNINIVFSGHEHNYSRRIIDSSFSSNKSEIKNSIYQIISGGGGEKLKSSFKSKKGVIVPPIAKYHFVVVDLDINNINVEAVSVDGKTLDKFRI